MDTPDHGYEEIRSVVLDLLAGREEATHSSLNQYNSLMINVAAVFSKRERGDENLTGGVGRHYNLSVSEREKFLELFWGLFREGVITLGMNDSNREFPWFRVSEFGRRLLEGGQAHFFHDVSSYERAVTNEVPNVDKTTLVYLKEAMQAFKSGCILSSSVMLGVATEHTFLLLIETIARNPNCSSVFSNVDKQQTILQKVNKFKNILDQQQLPPEVKEDIDTNFAGILAIIRTFRNQAGHPTGKIIDREQAYVLLHLFITYCRKMYQLMDYYK